MSRKEDIAREVAVYTAHLNARREAAARAAAPPLTVTDARRKHNSQRGTVSEEMGVALAKANALGADTSDAINPSRSERDQLTGYLLDHLAVHPNPATRVAHAAAVMWGFSSVVPVHGDDLEARDDLVVPTNQIGALKAVLGHWNEDLHRRDGVAVRIGQASADFGLAAVEVDSWGAWNEWIAEHGTVVRSKTKHSGFVDDPEPENVEVIEYREARPLGSWTRLQWNGPPRPRMRVLSMGPLMAQWRKGGEERKRVERLVRTGDESDRGGWCAWLYPLPDKGKAPKVKGAKLGPGVHLLGDGALLPLTTPLGRSDGASIAVSMGGGIGGSFSRKEGSLPDWLADHFGIPT